MQAGAVDDIISVCTEVGDGLRKIGKLRGLLDGEHTISLDQTALRMNMTVTSPVAHVSPRWLRTFR